MKQFNFFRGLAIALMLICCNAVWAYDIKVDGIYYNIKSTTDFTVEVTQGGIKYSGDIVIPSTITYNSRTFTVRGIGEQAFFCCNKLKSVVFGDSVSYIGERAFGSCGSLTSIEIPNSVQTIWDYAFYDCTGLTSIKIPNGIKTIWSETFYGCASLTSIEIPNSLVVIGNGAFNGCRNLTSIKIPNGVESIQNRAFANCTRLTSVIIPESVDQLYDNVFEECHALKSIYVMAKTPLSRMMISYLNGISSGCFTNKHYMDAVLYVPTGSLEAYKNAEVWKEFWEIKEYSVNNKVTYIVDGEIYATDSVAFGDSIVLIDAPTKEGYTFSGWSGVPSTMPPHDITIEGTFSVNTYAVTYVVDGDVYATDSVAYGAELVLPDEPAKEGYTFSGWGQAPKTMPAEDITIEGTFSVNSYILIFLLDGEVYETATVEYGTEIELPTVPEKEGYKFSGWMNVPVTMPAHNVTIKGAFTVNYYTVTYIVDGETYATDSVAYGSELVLRDEPAKEGHVFSGWGEAPKTMPAEDIIIEGTFSVNSYILTFMIDGEVYETATIEYGTEIKLPTVPEKEGYKFSGWMNVPATMPANDIIVEGHYIADTAIGQVYIDLEKNEVYNLKGLRVTETNKLARGIYIINGKKVLLK